MNAGNDAECTAAARAAEAVVAAMGGALTLGADGVNHAFDICGAATPQQRAALIDQFARSKVKFTS